jgi:DNA-binding transcriptional regulator YhcF (GntR family)
MTWQGEGTSTIYTQVARYVTDEILAGTYPDGSLVPSTNDLAAKFTINPATAGRALRLLVKDHVLETRRGIGTAVSAGGSARLAEQRRASFPARQVLPLLAEARVLGISLAQLQIMLVLASPETSPAAFPFEAMVAAMAAAV